MSLLSEHKYVFPEHIKPISQVKLEKPVAPKKQSGYQYPNHIKPVHKEMATSSQSFTLPDGEPDNHKMSKDNETTPALQMYIKTLANKQKNYINNQIQREQEAIKKNPIS